MNYATVCSGIEAPSVAWEPLGWKPQWFSEIERFPSQVLAHHYPSVPNLGDMTTIHRHPHFQYAAIDLLCGGTPCQSFSVAGLRKGLADPRGNLMLTFLALADAKRPRWLVWENVPGVLSSNGGRDFGTFLGALAELGYGWAYRVLDAQYFGVAQRRRRVFVVGCLGSQPGAAAVLFERYSLSGHPAPSRKAGQDIAGTLTSGAARRRGSGVDPGELVSSLTTRPYADNESHESKLIPVAMCMATGQGGAEIGDQIAPTLNCNHEAPIAFTYGIDEEGNVSDNHFGPLLRGGQGGTRQSVAYNSVTVYPANQITSPTNRSNPEPELCHTLSKSDCTPLGVFSSGAGSKAGEIAYALQAGSTRVNPNSGPQGAGVSEELAYTLEARKEVQIVGAQMAVRRLTPLECERLQGFPDGYTDIQPNGKPTADGPRYKALGNSMAVPVVRMIGQRIQAVNQIIC